MCGVLSIFSWNGQAVEPENLRRGLEALRHRGPDDTGIFLSEKSDVALGHTRLSIIDLQTGQQPLHNTEKNISAVVNGEFYGYQEIRAALQEKGHMFQTASDSEILIHLYAEYGVECLKFLRGEFAFVLWDHREQRLFAARDRFGVKPLCYHVSDDGLRIASEAKALFATGIAARWDAEAFYHATCLQYTPQDRSLFQDIAQLKPGHFILAHQNDIRVQKYWDMDYPVYETVQNTQMNEDDLVKTCHDLLYSAVEDRLQADVPVCFHLSGGIDSSAVLGMAAKMSDKAVDAFTVSFAHEDYNEFQQAQETADFVGARFHPVHVSQDDLVDSLTDAVYHGEGLAVNGHFGAKFLLNKAIHKAGFKVALTGEGADEVLAGYPHLREDLYQMEGCADDVAALYQNNTASSGVMMASGTGLPVGAVQNALGYVPGFLKAKASLGYRIHGILSEDFAQQYAQRDCYQEIMESLDLPQQCHGRHVVHQSLYIWTKFALTNYILRTLGDGMEMSQAIEGRLPFLDHKFFVFLRDLPVEMKIKNGVEKYILREAVKPYITDTIYKRQKHPFMAPPVCAYTKDSRFETLLQDIGRSQALKDIPFFDRKKFITVLDNLKHMDISERRAMEPVFMTVVTAGLLQDRFKLGKA